MTEALSAVPTFRAEAASAASPALERAPFRWTQRDKHMLPVDVRGELPSWLAGQLVRTAPAVFQTDSWRADHWFDGLALLYGFEFTPDGVRFRQRLLASRTAALAQQGKSTTASFGSPLRRSFLKRLVQPVPPFTDNMNVNVIPWQGQWLALSEVPAQHVIGNDDLATRGLYQYQDELAAGLITTAHPHFDFEGNALVNLGTKFGPKAEITVFRQGPRERGRTVEGKLALDRSPYVHDFGVTARHVVLIDHPLRVSPISLLWSNRGFIDHFKWQPETGTVLRLFDRQRGSWTEYQTEALFCFHVVNTFEDGADVVFDFVAYDDASIIDQVRTASLARGVVPALTPRYLRARLRPGQTRVELERLSDVGFDFPAIAYAREHGRPYHVAWGVAMQGELATQVVRVDTESSEVRRFAEPAMTYGEPVFVARPGAEDPHDGVLLTLGSHLHEERASLAVLDAETMVPLAHCDVALSLPLGFHGNFRAR